MPKKSHSQSPPSAEARAEMLAVIRRQPEPITAKAIIKLLPIAMKVSEPDLIAALREHVSTSQLFEYPSKTSRGPTRYWDRDTRELARGAISKLISSWPEPLLAKELSSRLGLPFQVSESDLTTILADFAARGILNEIPSATGKGKVRYWNRDRAEHFRRSVLHVLEQKGTLPEVKLQSALKGITSSEWQQVRDKLQTSRVVFAHPPVGKKGKVVFGLRPPAAAPYLKDIARPLATIVTTLTEAGVPSDDIRRAIVEMVEAAGITFGLSRTPVSKTHDAIDSSSSTVSDQLIELMLKMEPGAARGTLVGVHDLRRLAHMDKVAFDTAILQLSRQGKVALHRDDFPANLSSEERDELVTDGTGNYFRGLVLRMAEGGDHS